MFKVVAIVNFEMEAGRNPEFIFETFSKVITFTKLCLENGYEVTISEIIPEG